MLSWFRQEEDVAIDLLIARFVVDRLAKGGKRCMARVCCTCLITVLDSGGGMGDVVCQLIKIFIHEKDEAIAIELKILECCQVVDF